jgi:hypothetical protein
MPGIKKSIFFVESSAAKKKKVYGIGTWSHFNYLPAFQLGPDHEGIHGTLYMIWWVLLRLKKKK